LWRKDFQTSQEGYTLAAVLLFGKDEVIQQVLPHYKIDALVRIVDTHRFDDRLYIQTNLIDAYDLLMAFMEKHLPDKFYLRGDQRISLRTLIFREIIANLIVHREYTNAQPCSLVIYKDKVICTNANNPHGEGPIDPKNFAPYPKNPALAKFFIQLGRVDELGSGVLNVYRLVKEYGGKGQPLFMEGSSFSVEVPIPTRPNEGLSEGAFEGAFEGATEAVKTNLSKLTLLIASNEGLRTPELQRISELSKKTLERYLKALRDEKIIEFKGDAPQKGGYYLTQNIKEKLR
jgi:ATP-dependent DNA helicase RecG